MYPSRTRDCRMVNPPVSGGPRLGKLPGLQQHDDNDKPKPRAPKPKEGGIKVWRVPRRLPTLDASTT